MPSPKSTPAMPPPMRLEQVADILLQRHAEEVAKQLEEKRREVISEVLAVLDDTMLPEWFPEVSWDYVEHTDEYVLIRDELDGDGTGVVIGIYRNTFEVFVPLQAAGLRLPIRSAVELASYVMAVTS